MAIVKAHSAGSSFVRLPPQTGVTVWVALAFLWLLSRMPLGVSRALGVVLGGLMHRVNAKRRRIARTNIDLCFPELSTAQRARLLRRHFRLLGQSYLDTAFVAWGSERRFGRKTRLTGLDYLRSSLARGRRIILLAPHCVGMNVGGIIISRYHSAFAMVKPQRSTLVNGLLEKARSRYGAHFITREQGLRAVLRRLDEGMIFHYSPDEDFGPRRSVFVPFFGVSTATLPTLGRLAERARVSRACCRKPADTRSCCTRRFPIFPAMTASPTRHA